MISFLGYRVQRVELFEIFCPKFAFVIFQCYRSASTIMSDPRLSRIHILLRKTCKSSSVWVDVNAINCFIRTYEKKAIKEKIEFNVFGDSKDSGLGLQQGM